MTDTLIRLLIMGVACAIWYWNGRQDGRNKERKRLMPWVECANPILHALRNSNAEKVVATFDKTDTNTWHGYYTIYRPEDTE